MRVVTFGEIMLRIAPQAYNRFFQNNNFEITFGGGEANVAVSLANFGIQSEFVTKLPKNDIGLAASRELNKFGVKTNNILFDENRMGIYFLEKGASQRPSKVIYDRSNSSVSNSKIGEFNWEKIFDGVDWFHFTGITPALSKEVAEVCEEALKIAKKRKVKVSCDLNYRKNLWTQQEAKSVMTELMQYVDVLIANEEDAHKVFNIKPSKTDVDSGQIHHEGYIEVAKELIDKFTFEKVFITLRESITANDNRWSAMIYQNNEATFSKVYDLHIVDRVGGGDSFGAGVIYSELNNFDAKKTIEFAVGASALKHTIEGDFNRVTVEEVMNLIDGDSTGRVQR